MDVVAIAEVVSTMDRITLELLVMIFVFSPCWKRGTFLFSKYALLE